MKAQKQARNNKLKTHYGITLEDYDRMFKAQKGVCKICGTSDSGGNGTHLHVDHDHTTKEVRGLLCSNCNRALGLFNDDVTVLANAIEYLKRT